MVQLREKDLSGATLLDLAQRLVEAVGDRALVVVNERSDIAAISNASGVQLGEEAIPVSAARSVVGDEALIGRSVHSEIAASLATEEGADFLIAGTMFATGSHPDATPAGPGLVRLVVDVSPLPVIGIGGITPANLDQVLAAGAAGVAVISSILASPDPERAAADLKEALVKSWPGSKSAPVSELEVSAGSSNI